MPYASMKSLEKYSRISRVLHWLVAFLVLLTWPMGLMIGFAREDVKLDFYLVHESLGFLVLWIMLVRVGARLASPAPKMQVPTVERVTAQTVHGLLYLSLIAMPVTGFLATNAHGFPLQWFGLVPVWSPLAKSPDLAPILSAIHEWSAWIVLGLVALHVVAVIFHHVFRRDATLYRMI